MPPSRNFHKQGAEGIVYLASELGQDVAIKHRFKKAYRLPELDTMLTSSRLKQEVRSILRARRLGVRAPVICRVDLERSCIVMHKIEGKTVKDAFLRDGLAKERKHKIATELGRMIAVLHDGDLIHGELTTSNMMLGANDEVHLIDFGLSQLSTLAEDKAVDMCVS